MRESECYQQQSRLFARFLSVVANIVATVMGIGAVFAALNTMCSSVSARITEIATLRALGFGSIAVVASVLVEALLLALVGSLLDATIAWLLFNGNTVSTVSGGSGMSQVVFHLRIGWELVIAGIVWAVPSASSAGSCRQFVLRECRWPRRFARCNGLTAKSARVLTSF